MRKFEVLSTYQDKGIHLPKRATQFSAGYDVEAAEDVTIYPLGKTPGKEGEIKGTLVPTGLKVYCGEGEYVALVSRSSNFNKLGLMLANNLGIADKDYADNPGNEGHIFFNFINFGSEPVAIKKGDRVGQAIFHSFLVADDDTATGERTGGFGSTDEK